MTKKAVNGFRTWNDSGVTLSVFHDTRRARSTGLYPVKLCVTHQRKRVYYPSVNLSESDWELLTGPKNKWTGTAKDAVKSIDSGFDQIVEHIKEVIKAEGFSFAALNKRMSRGDNNTLLSAFEAKIAELKRNDQIGTATYYLCASNSFAGYDKRKVNFSAVTPEWLRKYEKFMLSAGMSYTTIAMYLRALRTIVNEAKREGIITASQYPFTDYHIPTAEGRKMALTVAQIGQVLSYQLTSEVEMKCRDLWFFSYLCNGINMNDLLRLKYTDIQDGEIFFYRRKTIRTSRRKNEIAVTILPEMQRIIDQWGGPGDFIFPGMEEAHNATDERRIVQNVTRLINKKMNDIGKALGYGPISTYTARHSYATVLKRSGADISFISESLGHSSVAMTANYLKSFEKGERAKNAANLVNFEK